MRRRLAEYRQIVDTEARERRDSYFALEKLRSLYLKLDVDEREAADLVISEWVESDDEGVRFDALVLIDDFKIGKARPALRALMDRLASSSSPGAPYEREKVERIAASLL